MEVSSSKDPSPDALKALDFPVVVRSAREAAKSASYSVAEAYFIEALRRGKEHGLVPALELAQIQIEFALLRTKQQGISPGGLASIAKLLELQSQSLVQATLESRTIAEREQLFELQIEIALLQVDVLSQGTDRGGIAKVIAGLYRQGELFAEHAALALAAISILEAEDELYFGGFVRAIILSDEAHSYLADQLKPVSELRKKLAARLLRLHSGAFQGMLQEIEALKSELRREKFQMPHLGLLGGEPFYHATDVAREIESRGVSTDFLKVFSKHPGDTLCRGGILLALNGAAAEIGDKAYERREALGGLLGDS